MGSLQTRRLQERSFIHRIALFTVLYLAAGTCVAQVPKPTQPPDPKWAPELAQHPELLTEFRQLLQELQRDVHLPPPRSQSRLLPLLPETTMSYAALPNYGDAAHQLLTIFREELRRSAALREWWRHGEVAVTGPKIEDSLEKFYQLSQYLGDEIVVSGAMNRDHPSLLAVAEIRKPGLKTALQQVLKDLAAKSTPGVRVLDMQELAVAQDALPGQELLVLVRPDYVVAALDVDTLRSFNVRLDRANSEFVSTPFGQRVAQAYEDGVTIIAATDLQQILSKLPADKKQDLGTLQRTGFADVKYLIWEHASVGGQNISQSELSFIGPRHGIASWLGPPSPLGSLDFASPKAIMAVSLVLSNPAQIYEDIRELATAANSNAFAFITQLERALKLSFEHDLLRPLTGEVTLEIDKVTPPAPVWKAILRVHDPLRLQQTLSALQSAMQLRSEQFEESGVTYHTLHIPAGKTMTEIGYAFVDGYLVIGSGSDTVMEAVQRRRTGGSLGKSPSFLASLPPGHPSGVSALFYEDPIAMTALRLQQMAPEIVGPLAQLSGQNAPAVMCAYGEETAIRGASTSVAVDAGVVLVAAAITIPNLLRARIAANEASAVATLRTLNVAQITYAASYPKKGFASDLAMLGPAPGHLSQYSADHAGLIADPPGCAAGKWCERAGFRFSIQAVCTFQECKDYVVVGTPLSTSIGIRSFCSTSDRVIRFKVGPPLTTTPSVSECRTWPSLQ